MPRKSYHEIISSTKAYCAHDDLIKNTQWNSLGRDGADVLNDRDGTPAILTIIGEIVNDKLIVGPLGNFQSQEDKFKSDNKMTCDQAKLVVVIRSPSRSDHPNWAGDYEGATKNLKDIQETVAKSKPNAPRQYFLDFKTGNVPTTRFTHILWEKKSTQDENEEYDSDPQPKDDLDPSDDELMNSIQSKAVDRAKATAKYGSAVPPKIKTLFKETAQDYDIKQPKFFRIKNGVDIPIPPALYRTRLENALVEVTFSLRHYYMTHQKNHSFTASIQTLRILSSDEIQVLSLTDQVAIPTKRKSTPTDDNDNEQSPPKKKGKGRDPDQGSSTTEDENDKRATSNKGKDKDTDYDGNPTENETYDD